MLLKLNNHPSVTIFEDQALEANLLLLLSLSLSASQRSPTVTSDHSQRSVESLFSAR